MEYLDPNLLFKQVHPASLALTRILFGFLMLIDIPEERGGSEIDIRWGEPYVCHFPLFSFMAPPTYPWMCLLYGVMWFGALGMTVGFKFRISCAAYLLPYWYILLLDKTFWNNHSYLYGLLAFLMSVSSAGQHWSFDALLLSRQKHRQQDRNDGVPFWNYFLVRFQVFLLYFFAGLKKLDMEWLEGYSMTNLGQHWVFDSFGLILTTEQIDYLVIHIAGFLLDLSVGFFLLFKKTRPPTMLCLGMFHLMNSRLFSIGMFPYVGIVTIPIFCAPDWPVTLYNNLKSTVITVNKPPLEIETKEEQEDNNRGEDRKSPTQLPSISKSQKLTVFSIVLYCLLQLFLPWSHGITKGYNNWTNGLYGYSWDMMVHSWDTTLVIVRVVDNSNGKELFLDPAALVHNDRWNKHGDMLLQYAHCVQKGFKESQAQPNGANIKHIDVVSENISVYVDVWCSLNGRFQQRMFHPHYDLLKANWSPFSNVEWLLPLLIEYSDFREKMKVIQEEVYSWSNYSDVLFVADFPDLYLENFITEDLVNITLTVIEGTVVYESEDKTHSQMLQQGEHIAIPSNVFHKIKTVSKTPSCFMYTYFNSTKVEFHEANDERYTSNRLRFPLVEEGLVIMDSLTMMFQFVGNALLYLVYDVPMVRRARLSERHGQEE